MPTSPPETRASPRLRVGIFIALLPPDAHGGAEYQAERLARELARRGHDVHVFARRLSPKADTQRHGFTIHRRPVLPLPGLRALGEIVMGVGQALRARPRILLCYITLNNGLLGWITSRLARVPFIIWTRCDVELLSFAGHWRQRVQLFLQQRADAIWLQSGSLRDLLRRELETGDRAAVWSRLEARLRVLGNAIDVPPGSSTRPVPPEAPRFVFIGRLVASKNLPFVFEALRQAPGVELEVVGDGPLRRELEAAATGLPVRFRGPVPHDEIPSVLAGARALVLCSREEGVPNVVLEALAAGRPVIAAPVGAIPELLQDGVNGLLVPLGDVSVLARAFVALTDDEIWERLAAHTRASVRRFDWSELTTRVETELLRLAEPRSGFVSKAAGDNHEAL